MPLIKEPIILDDVSVYLWEINETKDELIMLCQSKGINTSHTENIRSKQRVCEKLGTLLILNHIFGKDCELQYTEVGAPRIKGKNVHISISHSSFLVGVAVSHLYPLGIDIEYKVDQVIRVRKKFLNEEELKAVSANDKPTNLFYWTAKEAVYKAIEAEGLDFRNDIYGSSYNINTFEAKKDGQTHLFNVRNIMYDDELMLTIATPKENIQN